MKKNIKTNFKDKETAVNYNVKNIEDLLLNLTNASEDVTKAYAEFKGFPISITAIDESDYVSHEKMILETLIIIDVIMAYMSDIKSDLLDYYKPEDYHKKLKSEIKRNVDNHLFDYIDSFSNSDVVYSEHQLSKVDKRPHIKIDDGNIRQVKRFL